MLFREIIGQGVLKKRLLQSVKDQKIGHAWLFSGSEGSGALALALSFARYILCTDPHETDACNICSGCVKSGKYIHPDMHFIFPVNKTKTRDTENPVSDDFIKEFREFLRLNPYGNLNQWYDFIDLENKQGIIGTEESKRITAKLSLKSFESEYKVTLIWHPEKMNAQAANKLLKLIEEPPPLTIFIMVSENPDQLLQTIKSRCIPLRVPRIENDDLLRILQEKHALEKAEAMNLIRLAEGNYLRINELLTNTGGEDDNFSIFRDLMRSCFRCNIQELVLFSENLSSCTREKQKTFLEYGLKIIRESMIFHFQEKDLNIIPDTETDFTVKFSPFVNANNVVELYDEFNKAFADIERNANSKIVFLDLSLKLSVLIKK